MFKIRYNKRVRNVIKYYLNNQLHRENGPAVEYQDGRKEWMLFGKLHRLDGPACEYPNGNLQWFISDTEYSEQEWSRLSRIYLKFKKMVRDV